MPHRVVILSIVLVVLGLGWTYWPRMVYREVSHPALGQSTPSAVEEAGIDQPVTSVSSGSPRAAHIEVQFPQHHVSLRPVQPQPRRPRLSVRPHSIAQLAPQKSEALRSPQEGLSTSIPQGAPVSEEKGTGASTSGLAGHTTKDGDLKSLEPGTATLGEPMRAQVPILQPPVLLAGPPPEYPSEGYHVVLNRTSLSPLLQVEAIEGRVTLRLLVVAKGEVDRVEVTVPSGVEILDQAAATAARAWRFAPATRDGRPIDAWVVVPIRFIVR